MSGALSFTSAAERPNDPDSNTIAHQALLALLNDAAAGDGWVGSAIDTYVVIDGHFSITIVPGAAPATIDDLRRFREEQKQAALAQPRQGELI